MSAEFSSHPTLAPNTFTFLKELQDIPKVGSDETAFAFSTIADLMALRRRFQGAAGDFIHPEEQRAAKAAIEMLDEFIRGNTRL